MRSQPEEPRKEHFLFDNDRLLLSTTAPDSDITQSAIGWAFANRKIKLPETVFNRQDFKFIL